jgi:hypothetical protein
MSSLSEQASGRGFALWRPEVRVAIGGIIVAAVTEFCVAPRWSLGMIVSAAHDLYPTLAQIFGALLGFVLTAVSIVMGLLDRQELAVLARAKPAILQLYGIYTNSIRYSGIATLSLLTGMALSREGLVGRMSLYVNAVFVLVAAYGVYRCAWAMEKLIAIVVTAPDGDGS